MRQALGADGGARAAPAPDRERVLAAVGLVARRRVLRRLAFALSLAPHPRHAADRHRRPRSTARVLGFTMRLSVPHGAAVRRGPALARVASRLQRRAASERRGRRAAARGRMRNALVTGEITLTVVLLAAAGLLLRSYARCARVDPGFQGRSLAARRDAARAVEVRQARGPQRRSIAACSSACAHCPASRARATSTFRRSCSRAAERTCRSRAAAAVSQADFSRYIVADPRRGRRLSRDARRAAAARPQFDSRDGRPPRPPS